MTNMEFLRYFPDVAAETGLNARELDEGRRFPLCRPNALEELFRADGLCSIRCEPLEIATAFASFDDYWRPLLGGTGPAPSYALSLDDHGRKALEHRLDQAPAERVGWNDRTHRACVGGSRIQEMTVTRALTTR